MALNAITWSALCHTRERWLAWSYTSFIRLWTETTQLMSRMLHSDTSINETSVSHNQFTIKTIMGSALKSVLLQSYLLTPPTSTSSAQLWGLKGQSVQFSSPCLLVSPCLWSVAHHSAFQKDTQYHSRIVFAQAFTCSSQCLFDKQNWKPRWAIRNEGQQRFGIVSANCCPEWKIAPSVTAGLRSHHCLSSKFPRPWGRDFHGCFD